MQKDYCTKIFIDWLDIKIDKKLLSSESKEKLYNLPYRHLVEFFFSIGSLDKESKNLFFQINDMRNQYILYPKMTGNVKEDSIKILNLLSELLERKLSVFRFYDIKDGVLTLKEELRNNKK